MKRIQEKVKDLVQVRSFAPLPDLYSDSEATLENYRFTDGTSTLMANWLDAVSRVSFENGIALALAGYRGVGKSHFLAAFGAIVSKPELRSKLADGHVSASAQTLMRRHYPVVRVWRGSKATLLEEVIDGVKAAFGPETAIEGDSIGSVLRSGASKWADIPLVVIVDTAMDRATRVARDDGPALGELAEVAKSSNVVVCAALDDDIAGADGTNSAISRTFQIDFLDQEHLYKVVDLHIFPKNHNVTPVISEIYDFFKSVVPNFRWSAQRFSSLYPLHPGILEIAPYVRLFVHDFALLSFAAEAGERILGRPANSLIALDEVFDKAENNLRKIDDLKEAFVAYDKLNSEVVSKVPVMQRLQAKLVLKALLLLSLDGRGATAEDICASMLIFDEAEPEKAASTVRGIIEMFSTALPDDISIQTVSGGDTYYSFRVSSKDDLNSALQEGASKLDSSVVRSAIRRLMQERFGDFTLPIDPVADERSTMECVTLWRGGYRRGRVTWRDGEESGGFEAQSEGMPDALDWEVVVNFLTAMSAPEPDDGTSRVVWKPDDLRVEEIDTILRHHVLQNDISISEQFGENVRASLHAHRIACEKILDRIMLENGKLVIDGFDYNFTEEARGSTSLTDLFSIMLEPLFETRYPEHPYFAEPLGMSEVSRLVSDLYSGSRQNLAEVQHLARTYGVPLGLVREEGSVFVPVTGDALDSIPAAALVLNLVDTVEDDMPLRQVYGELKKAPRGLVREAQHLILASLVADRRIEFVTSGGDRINSRSLDLRIIWDEIAGIAKTKEHAVSSKGLLRWAKLLTGDDSFTSISDKAEKERLRQTFGKWLEDWDRSNAVARFESVSDTHINTRMWTHAARVKSTFGALSAEMRNAVDGSSTVEDVLYRAIAIFADLDEEIERSSESLKILTSFLDACEQRNMIATYVSAAELTAVDSIEMTREALLAASDQAILNPAEGRNREVGYLWERFQKEFSEYFSTQHNLIMRSHDLQEKYDDIRRTDIWFEFESLSNVPMLRGRAWQKARTLKRQLEQLNCTFDVSKALTISPTCICSFRLSEIENWQELPAELWASVSSGLTEVRAKMNERKDLIVEGLQRFAKSEADPEAGAAANELLKIFASGTGIPKLSRLQLDVLGHVLGSISSKGMVSTNNLAEIDEAGDGDVDPNYLVASKDVFNEDIVLIEM